VIHAIVSGILVSGMYLLIALGFMLLYRICDIANMAHGAFVVGGMYATMFAVNELGIPYPLAVVPSVLISLPLLALIYFLVIRRSLALGHRAQIVYTLILLSLLQSVYVVFFGTDPWSLKGEQLSWTVFGVDLRRELVLGSIVAIIICALLFGVFKFTDLGRSLEASGKYPEGARAIGLPIDRYYAGIFFVGSAMAVMAGGLIVGYSTVVPFNSLNFLVIAFMISFAARLSFVGSAGAAIVYAVGYLIFAEFMDPNLATVTVYAVMMGLIILGSQAPRWWETVSRARSASNALKGDVA